MTRWSAREGPRRSGPRIRAIGVAAALVAAAVAAFPVVQHWRGARQTSAARRHAGISGAPAEEGRSCSIGGDDSAWRNCVSAPIPGDLPEVVVSTETRTGRLSTVMRTWRLADSAAVSRTIDSIEGAMAGHGGASIRCPELPPQDTTVSYLAAWRFDGHDLRVMALRPLSRIPNDPWRVQVFDAPVGFSGCQPGMPRRRLLTPREAWMRLLGRME